MLHGQPPDPAGYLSAVPPTTLACDFLHVDCAATLCGVYVLCATEFGARHLGVLGVTSHPGAAWTTQQAWNLLMDLGERVDRFRFMVRDRAGQFAEAFDAVLAGAGIEVAKIPCGAQGRSLARRARRERRKLPTR